ncbi:MAG TPA: Yip1 family protein [Anaerolineae bacterium]|nr:Yip1 family protein [Anaerolineae bacterium]HQK12895.1 Yip1 family protein [Anaerolineae bacterium]
MSIENTAKPTKKNIIALLVGVLIRPRATFGYLKDNYKRGWWLPAILIVLLTVAPLFAAARQVPAETAPVVKEMEMPAVKGVIVESGGMPVEPPPAAPSSGAPGILALGGAILRTPLAWLLWGGALYLASVFLGRSSNFGQMFRLAVWTWLPYGIRGLVQTVYILMTGNAIVNSGLSGFVIDKKAESLIPPGPGQLALASILGRVDIYALWHLLLVSVGLMAFTNLTRKKAWTAALVIWLVLALLGIVPAIFGGMFSNVLGNLMGPRM